MSIRHQIYIIDSPVYLLVGEAHRFSIQWLNASKLVSPSMNIWHNRGDVTGDTVISGDDFYLAGNVMTLKKITALPDHEAQEYIAEIKITADGQQETRKLEIKIVSNKS